MATKSPLSSQDDKSANKCHDVDHDREHFSISTNIMVIESMKNSPITPMDCLSKYSKSHISLGLLVIEDFNEIFSSLEKLRVGKDLLCPLTFFKRFLMIVNYAFFPTIIIYKHGIMDQKVWQKCPRAS